MEWIEISVTVERAAADEVAALLDDMAENGFIEEEMEDCLKGKAEESLATGVEERLGSNDQGSVKLIFYVDPASDTKCSDIGVAAECDQESAEDNSRKSTGKSSPESAEEGFRESAEERCQSLRHNLEARLTGKQPQPVSAITVRIVNDDNWYNNWQQYAQPVEILPGLIVKLADGASQTETKIEQTSQLETKQVYPQKMKADQASVSKGSPQTITIASTLSFGSGAHETTRCCAELLADYAKGRCTCLDIGTGTGLLLIIAGKLGLRCLTGIDIDPEAVAQARRNCEQNGIDAVILEGDLDSVYEGQADLITANLTVDPLKALLPLIGKKLAENGILIISGIIEERYNEIMPYITAGWQILDHRQRGVWHTFALERNRL